MDQFADHSLIAAKLAPPLGAAGLARAQAEAKLRAACRPGAVVVVQAPAGFGKTIALKSLYEALDDAAWLTLDAFDSCWALRRYARAALDGLGPRGTLIVTGLGAMPAAQEAFDTLLEMIGPRQTLAVGSSARVQHAGAARIGADDLRLDRTEVAQLCDSPEQADTVWELACGWPEVSMLLARSGIAAPDTPVPNRLLDAIAAFIEDEVISRLSPELGRLLGMLALLPAASRHVPEALMRVDYDALDTLLEETPFFTLLDDGTLRFVPIFQLVARRHRPAINDLPSKSFLIQASSLYAEDGMQHCAAWCAILAGSYRRAAAHILAAVADDSNGQSCPTGGFLEALAHVIAQADGAAEGELPQTLALLSAQAADAADLDALVDYCSSVGDNPAFGGTFKRLQAALAELRAARNERPADQKDEPVQDEEPALTPSEIRVMSLLAQGRSVRQIAADTSTSEATVRTHAKRAYRKLGAHGRKQAVSTALSRGLIQLD